MNEQETPSDADPQFAQAVVEKRRGPSIIWLIPIVAVLIGAWLLYKTISEQGPTIEISFKSAAGLEAGKTEVKFKNVEVGMVEEVFLSEDLSHVVAVVEMVRGAEPYLNENTRFWVVRARLGLGGVSGLSTLVSGSYIEVDPGDGASKVSFLGLEQPPLVKSDAKGRRFVLEADELGSLGPGAPVYFRGLLAGEVLRHELTDNDRRLDIHIFINAPYDEFVHAGSRFWNVSGVDIDAGAEGFRVEMASLETLLRGGVTFDSPDPRGDPSAAESRFTLFSTLEAAVEESYTEAVEYVAYFDGSLRGLKPGAPVEFRGLEIGEVRHIGLELDSEFNVQLPVRFVIKHDQVEAMTVAVAAAVTEPGEVTKTLIERGLRAQLRTGSLLTGQLFVDLVWKRDSDLRLVSKDPNVREFPTVPSTLDEFQATATDLMGKIHRLPLDEIATNLNSTLSGASSFANSPELQDTLLKINRAATSLDAILESVDEEAAPTMQSIRRAAVQAERTLAEAREALTILDEGSPVRADLARTLEEAAGAARSIRLLADYLERKPDALLYGKGGARR